MHVSPTLLASTATNVTNADPGSGFAVTDGLSGGTGNINYLLIGASVLSPTDAFKLGELVVFNYSGHRSQRFNASPPQNQQPLGCSVWR